MKRRTFITTAIAGGLGLGALLRPRPAVTATEPKPLTVKEWAEQNRLEPWEPLEVSYMPIPIFASRRSPLWKHLLQDEPDQFSDPPDLDRFARITYR